ncbi:MAG TPA: alpha-galactosidase, partial [Abditibacteriaceae bacterium]
FERNWRLENGLLHSAAFVDKRADFAWFAIGESTPMMPSAPVTEALNEIEFSAQNGSAFPDRAESLRVELRASGAQSELLYHFEVFPLLAGVVMRLNAKTPQNEPPEATPAALGAPTGVEVDGPAADAEQNPLDVLDNFRLHPSHLCLTQVDFFDQTDVHTELVQEREWRLHRNERSALRALRGNLFVWQDVLTGHGLIYLKHAALPDARPNKSDADLSVRGEGGKFVCTLRGHGAQNSAPDELAPGDEWILLAYGGGKAGRSAALQTYQRCLRAYKPERDAQLLSNTWGDRSRDGRINEDFMMQEVEAAARLGVDILQIDDGWQSGRSSNSVEAGGVWESYWDTSPHFWKPHPRRFPRGLEPLAAEVRKHGLKLGLWFSPDSSRDFANWNRDAAVLLDLHRRHNVLYFKMDGIKVRSRTGEQNLRALFDTVLRESGGAVTFDLDITAETRSGYWGLAHTGPLFVQNRYTDWGSYWPHSTLRALWQLSHYVDPVRLRMEWLNNARNTQILGDDPLAPARYSPAYLFATVMFCNPLGWFEVS